MQTLSPSEQVTLPPQEADDPYVTTMALWRVSEAHPADLAALSAKKTLHAKGSSAKSATHGTNAAQQQSTHLWLLILMLMMAVVLSMLFFVR
jgi:hypothetical protein